MPYIRRDFEDRPWFGALNDSLGSMIGLRQGEISDLRQQAGEQRSNAEFDRRTADTRKYAEGQQAAERQRTGQGQGLMLDALRTAGIIKDTPEVGALRGGLEKDGLPGFQQMMEMYARKVQQEQAQKAKADEEARAAQEAGALQRTLGIGQQRPAIPLAVPNGSNPVMAKIPGSPGETFQTPQAVEAAARIMGTREAAAATEANRARVDQRAADRLTLEQQRVEAYVQSVKNKGAPPTEEDIAGLADQIQAANPGIPASQAMGIARGRLQYKAPIQIPTETLAQKGEAENLKGQIGTLRSIRQSLLGPNGRSIAKKLGADLKIPEIPSETIKGQMNPDMVKIFEALDAQIGDLEAKRQTMGMAPRQGSFRQYPADVLTPQDREEYDALLKANAGGGR